MNVSTNNLARRSSGLAIRVVVLVVTLTLLFLMFDRGGWWIVICLAWLPVNFFVVGYFGDDKKSVDVLNIPD